jgi:CRISPR system Cascade subunit CasB
VEGIVTIVIPGHHQTMDPTMSTAALPTTFPPISDEVEAFIDRLQEADVGERARLKRNAGQSLGEGRGVLPLFFRILPRTVGRGRDVETYFLVATLFPLNPESGTGDFGQTLLRVARAPHVNRDGVDRRMAILLDAHRAELPFRIRQAVRLAASHDRRVDWRRLLADLLRWESPTRFIQKRWARSYFGSAT